MTENAMIVQTESASFLEMIRRASSDPGTDVSKLERLFDLYERMQSRNAEQAFHAAMNLCQAELRPISADASNPQTKSRYASYGALDHMVRPVYAKHGFSLSFDTGDGAPPEYVRIVCHVAHAAGHSSLRHVDMPADGKGAKGGDVMTKTHATGAAMSYGQRYLLKLIFNLAVGEDRDGNAPDTGEVISVDQISNLLRLIEETKSDLPKFLAFFKVDGVKDMRAGRYKDAVAMLEAKRVQK